MAEKNASLKRNPVWIRDELILALDLYLRNRLSPPSPQSKEVIDLSNLLNRLGKVLGNTHVGTYRNVNGVSMKMMNFRRFDAEYTADGKVGLTRGNKEEELIWKEFCDSPNRLAATVAAICLAVDEFVRRGEVVFDNEPEIHEAAEGRLLTKVHRIRERNPKLVQLCKNAALKKHGRLFCEACGFDFVKKYGVRGLGVIDVHHTKPLHTIAVEEKTRVNDLALLCSNCHRIVHSSMCWLSIEEVREVLTDR